MKIYYMGKRIRESSGRFSSFKKKLKKWTLIAVLVYGVYVAGGLLQPRAIATPVLFDNLTPKIEELKDSIVEDIRNCERSNYEEEDAPIILDTNKKMSIGVFMYQKATVQHYSKKLYGKELTGKEATLFALDEDKARQMTYDVIFKDSKGWANWYNCGKKIGVETRLQVIRELSK